VVIVVINLTILKTIYRCLENPHASSAQVSAITFDKTKPKAGCDDPLDRRGRQAALLLLRPTIAALQPSTRLLRRNKTYIYNEAYNTKIRQVYLSHPHQYCVPNCLLEVRQQVLRFKSICSQRIVRTTTKPTTASGDLFIVFIYKLYKRRNS
jgi:hypothetical protein